jgi:hypothetical protein
VCRDAALKGYFECLEYLKEIDVLNCIDHASFDTSIDKDNI